MIATALSTAGVNNCEVVAACPYEVSGTGALTGVMKAYESASGQALDSTKKDLAAKEVVVTGNVGQQVGQDNATNIINQAKMQIIGDNIQNADEIYNIVNNIAVQNGITLSQDELDTIVSLLQQIAQQNYDIQEMKKTLEDIQQNLEDSKNGTSSDDSSDDDAVDEGEDITQDVDSGALGDDVKQTSTEDANLAKDTGADTNQTENTDSYDNSGTDNIPDASGDGTTEETPNESTDGTTDGSTEEIPPATGDGTDAGTDEYADNTEDALNTDDLSEEAKIKFDQAKQFCKGEYEGDLGALQSVVEGVTEPPVTLDQDVAQKLSRKVLETYLKVLKDGGYVGKTVVLGIRPEDIHDSQMFIEASPSVPMTSTVKVYELLGAEVFLYFDVNGTQVTARVDPRTTAKTGDPIKFAFDMEKSHFFDKETELTICN